MKRNLSGIDVFLSLSKPNWNLVALDILQRYFQSDPRLVGFLDEETEPGLRLLQLAVPRPNTEPVEPLDPDLHIVAEPDGDDTAVFLDPRKVGSLRSRNAWHSMILAGRYELAAQRRDEVLMGAIRKRPEGSELVLTSMKYEQTLLMSNLSEPPADVSRNEGSSLLIKEGDSQRVLSLVLGKKNAKPDCYKEMLQIHFDFSLGPASAQELCSLFELLCLSGQDATTCFSRRISGVAARILLKWE